jgi:hypothetical protein
MNESKTSSMLQRIPVILAVTAASYGLQVPQQALRHGPGTVSVSRTASAGQAVVPARLPAATPRPAG